MSAISLKSISGITSITTPAGVDNQFTLHNNNTTEAVKLDTAGNLHFHNHLNITGVSTAREGVIIPDNKALSLGNRVVGSTAGDLRLYHDGSDSYIDEIGSGNLHIRNGSDNSIFCQTDGTVKLYNNGSEKLATTSSGVSVTGAIAASGAVSGTTGTFTGETDIQNSILRVTDGTPRIIMSVPSGGLDTRLFNDGSGNFIIGHGTNSDTPTERLRIDSAGAVLINGTDKNTVHTNADDVIIGNTSASLMGLSLVTSTSGYATLQFSDGGGNKNQGQIAYNHADDSMALTTAEGVRLRIASNGDIGLGTVPETDSYQPSLYFSGGNANIWGSGNANLYTAVNARYTGAGGWKYNNNGLASYTAQQSGTYEFRNAPSGTADNVATFTTRFQIDSAGKIGVGQAPNTAFNVKLGVFAATGNDDASDWGADGIFQLDHSGGNAVNNEILLLGAVSGGVGQIASGFGFGRESTSNWGTYLSFKTHSTGTSNIDELIERLRITSGGDHLFLGGTLRIKDSGNSAQRGAIYGDASSFYINAGGNLKLYSGGGERLVFDNNGNIAHNSAGSAISYFKGSSEYIFGSNASAPNQGGNEALFQIHHGKSRATASVNAFYNNAGGPILQFISSRSNTVGTLGVKCQSNDYLADLRFWGDNGTVNGSLAQGASIWVRAKSTPADGDGVIASEINFDTGSASGGSLNNVLKLRQDQQIEMAGARKVKINGLIEYYAAATMQNNQAYTFDFTVRSEGGYGNSYYIVVGYNHFHTSAYGAQRVAIVCTRGTALSINADIANVTHSQAGEWSFSKPNNTTLRITKSAGTYGGWGYGFIRMTGNGNTMGN